MFSTRLGPIYTSSIAVIYILYTIYSIRLWSPLKLGGTREFWSGIFSVGWAFWNFKEGLFFRGPVSPTGPYVITNNYLNFYFLSFTFHKVTRNNYLTFYFLTFIFHKDLIKIFPKNSSNIFFCDPCFYAIVQKFLDC